MARRLFFVEAIEDGQAVLEGDEALHLTRVLRVEAGERYEISDNRSLHLAEIVEARKNRVVFRLLEELERVIVTPRLHLVAAIIKFDHFEWMLEKATELGVEQVAPVIAERSDKGLAAASRKRIDRWRKIVRESSQQCRRWKTPEIEEPVECRRQWERPGLRFFLEEQRTAPPILDVLPAVREPASVVNLLVGPEGGWTDAERAGAAEAGWQAVSLGPTILRAETACLAGLAVIAAAWSSRRS